MAQRRIVSTAVLIAALALGASGCGGEDDPGNDASALPTPTTSAPTSATTTPPPESTSATAEPEAWRAKFSKDQLAAYERALQVWKQYGEITGAYFREPPKDLETVRRTYERFTYNAAARYDSYVETVVDGGLRVVTPPEPISYRGRSITLDPKGDLVVVVQCNDYSNADYRRRGERIKPEVANSGRTTARQRIELGSDLAGTWRILEIETVDRTCA